MHGTGDRICYNQLSAPLHSVLSFIPVAQRRWVLSAIVQNRAGSVAFVQKLPICYESLTPRKIERAEGIDLTAQHGACEEETTREDRQELLFIAWTGGVVKCCSFLGG
ncbi:hypothetical protein AC579_8064 [Pseudocercospora musae]|uniref:Uncharacterized protein n=1 Tax=Pseudocercospora musae TaxID=113226 RepID=A0A139HSE3_9PEZI|nr:hypothetical protein AC579_8064 [Pseudocercospora musae]